MRIKLYSKSAQEKIADLRGKYIWWSDPVPPDENFFLAQVMTLGVLKDLVWVVKFYGKEKLKEVLKNPPVGVFNARSWHFWHYWLGLAKTEKEIPPMPMRSFLKDTKYEEWPRDYQHKH